MRWSWRKRKALPVERSPRPGKGKRVRRILSRQFLAGVVERRQALVAQGCTTPTATMAEENAVSVSTVKNWMSKARDAGLLELNSDDVARLQQALRWVGQPPLTETQVHEALCLDEKVREAIILEYLHSHPRGADLVKHNGQQREQAHA